MFLDIQSNDPDLLKFLEENISKTTPSIILGKKGHRLLTLNFLSSENEVKISCLNQDLINMSKPFHFSEIINKINHFQQNYFVEIGPMEYFPFDGSLKLNEKNTLLSQTQNQILCSLVCFEKGIEKKKLYESIWVRDKNISDNKLDTHLTNLRNHIFDFSNYRLNFKTVRGSINLDIS